MICFIIFTLQKTLFQTCYCTRKPLIKNHKRSDRKYKLAFHICYINIYWGTEINKWKAACRGHMVWCFHRQDERTSLMNSLQAWRTKFYSHFLILQPDSFSKFTVCLLPFVKPNLELRCDASAATCCTRHNFASPKRRGKKQQQHAFASGAWD